MQNRTKGFTIVELLTVIVVIGILAAIVIVAYNGVTKRAQDTKRTQDMTSLLRAINVGRINEDKMLGEITGYIYFNGRCVSTSHNAAQLEPRDLPKTHTCWQTYYSVLDTLSAAANINLTGLRDGDSRGNPYVWDENEGESGMACTVADGPIQYFTGSGTARGSGLAIPKSTGC